MSRDTELTKEELLEKMDKALREWALGDIKASYFRGGAAMASFILGACFIDVMAGFRYWTDEKSAKGPGMAGRRFRCFVTEYLPERYDAETLWRDLRNHLVHSYTEGGTYSFTHEERDGRHFEEWSGKIILNVEDFIEDLEQAYEKLAKDIREDSRIFFNAKERYEAIGLLRYIPRNSHDEGR